MLSFYNHETNSIFLLEGGKMKKLLNLIKRKIYTFSALSVIAAVLSTFYYGTQPVSASCIGYAVYGIPGHEDESCWVSCGSSAGCYAYCCDEDGGGCNEVDVDREKLGSACWWGCGVECS
jgi:hypothetical protein